MLLSVPGIILLEEMRGIAVEHSASVWLLNFGCRINFVHNIGVRMFGRCAVAEILGHLQPAVRFIEGGVYRLSATFFWIGRHMLVRVRFLEGEV